MRFLILLLLTFQTTTIFAQNLILNPDFEGYDFCPWTYSQYFTVDHWTTPSKGTSDYYNSCYRESFPPTVKTPTNFFGHQKPKKGEAYSGLYCYYNDNYREYIQGQFVERLKEGKQYKLRFYVSLADTAAVAIQELGVAFLEEPFAVKNWFPLELPYHSIKAEKEVFLKDKKNWTALTLDYTAKGGERFLVIGNFKNNEETDTINIFDERIADPDFTTAYYYVDDVCMAAVDEKGLCPCINNGEPEVVSDSNYMEMTVIQSGSETPNRPRVGDIVILKNVYFDFDKATLRLESEEELKQLYYLLLEYPSLKIIINGHTDNKGNDDYNQQLSESRALAVYAYLVQKGIASTRLDFKGYGELKPITENNTNEGRQTNRRVEFEVIGE